LHLIDYPTISKGPIIVRIANTGKLFE
jgi:hypothetical protein